MRSPGYALQRSPRSFCAARPRAQTQQQIDWCLNKGDAVSPDLRINGCTAVIQSGRGSGNWAFLPRGNAYEDKGDHGRAIADYSEAIRLDPKDAFAYISRGISFYAKGDHGRAIADYSDAIRLDPKDADAYIIRGVAYHAKGDRDRAVADYNEAIRLAPNLAPKIAPALKALNAR